MKAHINGITIEGTPQEIAEYQRLQNEKSMDKLKWNPYAPKQDGQIPLIPQVTSGSTGNKCPNFGIGCFCTGACIASTACHNETYKY